MNAPRLTIVALFAAAAVLTGCGGTETASTTTTSAANSATSTSIVSEPETSAAPDERAAGKIDCTAIDALEEADASWPEWARALAATEGVPAMIVEAAQETADASDAANATLPDGVTLDSVDSDTFTAMSPADQDAYEQAAAAFYDGQEANLRAVWGYLEDACTPAG